MTADSAPGLLVPDVDDLLQRLDAVDYLADRGLATALFLAVGLPQPILLEGEAGVGKTEAAKALARVLETPLLRLQCYEGIDASEALYEWNYPRQLLAIRLAEAQGAAVDETDLFGADYLIARPLLQAIEHPGPRPAVLLVDEVDRADDEFEAFLFELLAEATVTIPELGTRHASLPPIVVLTSNRTPRPARRAQAPLPLPLDRLPVAGAGGAHRAPARARGVGRARGAGGGRGAARAQPRRAEATGCRGDDRLGRRAAPARCRPHRRGRRRARPSVRC